MRRWRFDRVPWRVAAVFAAAVAAAAILAAANPGFRHVISSVVRAPLDVPHRRASGESPLSADQPFVAALRELLVKDRGILQKSDRHGVHAFYRSRGFAPLWVENNQASARGRAVVAYLQGVDAEGLDPADYIVPDLEQGAAPEALAATELRLSAAVLAYARDAQNGRVPFSHFGADIQYAPKIVAAAAILAKIADAADVGAVLATFNPPHAGYQALKAKLAEVRAGSRSGGVREAVILANMERWRWMPRDLGESYVIVNIPNYTLTVYRGGSPYFRARIVVGEPSWPTPVTSAAVKSITLNPEWNVPASIAEREYLPLLAQDPDALERIGLEVERRSDGSVHLRQLPGEDNVLGRIRFNFPNRFLVFQHDTPDKLAFNHHKRAFSHGCMRVDNPLKYAEALLAIALPQQGYSEERLRDLFGAAEVEIELPAAIPVHLTYQTAFVDENARLVIREDIYGLDGRMLSGLQGNRRKHASEETGASRGLFSSP
jgi:murein L,D-transpeptidase YcbB/YkuD